MAGKGAGRASDLYADAAALEQGATMEDLAMRVAVFVAVGLASGFLSGLFGVGGGIIRIPIFLHLLPLFGVAHALVMHISVGTSIALVIPSAMASTGKQGGLRDLERKFFRTSDIVVP